MSDEKPIASADAEGFTLNWNAMPTGDYLEPVPMDDEDLLELADSCEICRPEIEDELKNRPR